MDAVRLSAASAYAGLSLEDHRSLFYRLGAPRLGFVRSSSVKNRSLSSSVMKIGLPSRHVTRGSFEEKRMKAGAESVKTVEAVNNATPAVSGVLQPEAKSAFQVPETAVREYWFVKESFLNGLKDLHELETGFALH